MMDNNAAKEVKGPEIKKPADIGGDKVMAEVSGDSVNVIEKFDVKSLASPSEKPLVASGEQVVKSGSDKGK